MYQKILMKNLVALSHHSKKSVPWPEPSGELRRTLRAVRADQILCVLEKINFLQ